MTPEELEQFIHRELRALPPRKAPDGFEARLQAKLEAAQALNALEPEQLERFVHRELRALPPRQAPRSLEARVMAALERQALIPWYHKSWAFWPQAVRAAFLAVATGVTGAIVSAYYLGISGVENSSLAVEASHRLSIFTSIYHVGTWIFNLGAQVVGSIPPLWLYGGAAFVALLYATFFGLGTAAYRYLYRTN